MTAFYDLASLTYDLAMILLVSQTVDTVAGLSLPAYHLITAYHWWTFPAFFTSLHPPYFLKPQEKGGSIHNPLHPSVETSLQTSKMAFLVALCQIECVHRP